MAGVKRLTANCPVTNRPCRRGCKADSVGHAGAMIEPSEELDRDVEKRSRPGSREHQLAQRHRQDRLDRETRKEVGRNPRSCPEN